MHFASPPPMAMHCRTTFCRPVLTLAVFVPPSPPLTSVPTVVVLSLDELLVLPPVLPVVLPWSCSQHLLPSVPWRVGDLSGSSHSCSGPQLLLPVPWMAGAVLSASSQLCLGV